MIFGCGMDRCCQFRQPKSEYTREKKPTIKTEQDETELRMKEENMEVR